MHMSPLKRRTTRIRARCAGAPTLEAGSSPAAIRSRQRLPAPRPRGHPAPRLRWVLVAAGLPLLTLGCLPLATLATPTGAGQPVAAGVAPIAANGSVCAQAVAVALSKQGSPYVLGAKGPTTFDCSGLVRWSYGTVGLTLGWSTYEQVNDGVLTGCTIADLTVSPPRCWEAGDLVFLRYPEPGAPGGWGQHVAIYTADPTHGYDFMGCENPTDGCLRQRIQLNPFYLQHFFMARRIVNCQATPAVATR